jgi:ADP-dependent NAD(P)H-hydrate dehydratase / NAD(P)H-hydrate epimerase
MTPHPLEAARLLNKPTQDIQADRIGSTQALSAKYNMNVVLKGPGSVITSMYATSIAPSGSPALAVGGTGDLLAGLIGSLMAQGFDSYLSAQLGTTIHALAGTLWSQTRPKFYGMKAEDLPEHIVTVMNTL